MHFESPAGMSRMESDTDTIEDCCDSAGLASVIFGSPASVGSIQMTISSEFPGHRTKSAPESDGRHESLIHSLVVLDADLAGFIPSRRHGGTHNSPRLLIPLVADDIPSISDFCLGRVAVKDEIASRVAGGPVAVQAVPVEGLSRPSR